MYKNLRKLLIKKIKNLINLFGWLKLSFASKDKKPPIYEKNSTEGLKVHIGPGEVNIQGWVNIDARNFEHVHIVNKKINFEEFTDGSIQEIYLCHILEHLSFIEIEEILELIFIKLKIGGLIRISVPDFDKIIAIYKSNNDNLNQIKHVLMGGQDYEYNFHKAVFNKSFLTTCLLKNGFDDTSEWDTLKDFGVDLGDWSNGKIKTVKGKMEVSLNLKAVKRD
jgi:predicted SAM-dependent methyltransferase